MNKSEKEFWAMTPRKLSALMDVHIKAKGGKTAEEQNEDAFEQLMQM